MRLVLTRSILNMHNNTFLPSVASTPPLIKPVLGSYWKSKIVSISTRYCFEQSEKADRKVFNAVTTKMMDPRQCGKLELKNQKPNQNQ